MPKSDPDWQKVEGHYNSTYAGRWRRPECSAAALKAKFRKLCFGPTSWGGERNEWEKRAKELERLIDEASGVITDFKEGNGKEEDVADIKSERKSKKGTRMNFEKSILTYLEESKEREKEDMTLDRKNEKWISQNIFDYFHEKIQNVN